MIPQFVSPLLSFPRDVVMKSHTLGGFTQESLIVSHFWGLGVHAEGVGRATLHLKPVEKDPSLPLPASAIASNLGS